MVTTDAKSPEDFIVPLYMNGLQGRMLRLPAPADRKREILFVYGHHSTLERWWGLVQDLNQYGGITMPDLPGFGGMESLSKIGEKPDIDTYADYLAAFVKLRYARRRVTIIGMSFGFVVATRMLQRYPDLAKKVDLLMSVAGFSHHEDFKFSSRRKRVYRAIALLAGTRYASIFFRNVLLHPLIIRYIYVKGPNSKHKFAHLDPDKLKQMAAFEVKLWHKNDVRTHWDTTHSMLTLDNCKKRVDLPVWHISVKKDQYFDAHNVEQHMRVIFNDYHVAYAKAENHAPSVLADAAEAAPMIPPKIRRVLSRNL